MADGSGEEGENNNRTRRLEGGPIMPLQNGSGRFALDNAKRSVGEKESADAKCVEYCKHSL